jgi:hypothetical protein
MIIYQQQCQASGKEKLMKLLILKQVYLTFVPSPVSYAPFLQSLLDFFSAHFEIEVVEEAKDVKEKLEAENISAVLFLSQAVLAMAAGMGIESSPTKFLVFCGRLGTNFKQSGNVYLIQKDAGGQTGWHLAKALEILKSG